MRLTHILPSHRVVSLGGRRVAVAQYTLGDLAALQAWLDAQSPDPLDALDGQEPDTLPVLLRAAHAAADRGPSCLGSPDADALLATESGATLSLWLSLRRADPSVRLNDAAVIAAAMDAADWQRFDRIAWNADPLAEIEARIDGLLGVKLPESERAVGSWGEAYLTANAVTHCTFAEFREMTLSQWDVIRLGGKFGDRCIEQPAGWTEEEFAERVLVPRARFWAGEGSMVADRSESKS